MIVCADVVEHLLNPDPCVGFIKRHLDADGFAYISTPERERLYGPDMNKSGHRNHVREWSKNEFAAYLASRGLRIHRHLMLPAEKTTRIKELLLRCFDKLGKLNKALSCQLAVCKHPNNERKRENSKEVRSD